MRRLLSESELKSVFEAIDLEASGIRKDIPVENISPISSTRDCYTINLSNGSVPNERN